jgi:hypothetical protein
MSIAPLVGYGYSPDPTPDCTDVCSEPIGNGLTVGGDASPATIIFGDDRDFELGDGPAPSQSRRCANAASFCGSLWRLPLTATVTFSTTPPRKASGDT